MNVEIKNAELSEYKKIIGMLNHFITSNFGRVDLENGKENVKVLLESPNLNVKLKYDHEKGKLTLKKV